MIAYECLYFQGQEEIVALNEFPACKDCISAANPVPNNAPKLCPIFNINLSFSIKSTFSIKK